MGGWENGDKGVGLVMAGSLPSGPLFAVSVLLAGQSSVCWQNWPDGAMTLTIGVAVSL